MEDPGRIIADISAFYEAFAFQPETEEAPDHLAVEAGFVGYLCLKEAFARARGNAEEAEIAAKAAIRFHEAHLSTLAWPVAEGLETTDVRYLTLAAAALARRSGLRRDTDVTMPGPRPQSDDCPLECGQT
jgi:nitrate reductase assembly molybdenum cofactor insertion protein NarJ